MTARIRIPGRLESSAAGAAAGPPVQLLDVGRECAPGAASGSSWSCSVLGEGFYCVKCEAPQAWPSLEFVFQELGQGQLPRRYRRRITLCAACGHIEAVGPWIEHTEQDTRSPGAPDKDGDVP